MLEMLERTKRRLKRAMEEGDPTERDGAIQTLRALEWLLERHVDGIKPHYVS